MTVTSRTYGDPCGVARALDVVGDRWALLVVRELLLGPKRFSDLHAGLGTVSQNVLSQRLRELEHTGVVRRIRLGPPARTWAYEVTERGAALEPVLVELGRWGREVPLPEGGELSIDALVLALKTTFNPSRAEPGLFELRIGDDVLTAEVDGQLVVRRAPAPQAPDRVAGPPSVIRAVAFGRRSFDDAVADGSLEVTGDAGRVRRFFGSFAPG